jgi:Leucine-rich repeat (LRR) protein
LEKCTDYCKEIGRLVNLTKLGLRKNQITILPAEIGQLTNLTELDLRGNKITHIPIQIEKLTKLSNLHVWFGQIPESEEQKIRILLPNCKIIY